MGLVQLTARMSEKFCLRWNDYHSNVSKSFSLFRNEEYLHDVTLVSDDHSKVEAHKLVLSACSEYFRDIFENNQHSHPLLCLNVVSFEDLKNIMDYIYDGEVQIFQEELDRFLNVAQRLKLQGLISGDAEQENKSNEIKNEPKNDVEEEIESQIQTFKPQTNVPNEKSNHSFGGTVAYNGQVHQCIEESAEAGAVAYNEQVHQFMEES